MTVALIATAIAALANWYSRVKQNDRVELISKPMVTVGAIAIATLADGPTAATAATVVALTLCLVGDVALLPAIDRFVVGLAAFLLGHIGFIVMFGLRGFERWTLSGVAVIGCALLLGPTAPPIVRGAAARGFGLPVRVYLVVIASMCVLGWATGNWLIMLGSSAFIVSDAVLGWSRFVTERKWMNLAVMVTYHVAIVSLAASLAI